jgi:hypothetical protein
VIAGLKASRQSALFPEPSLAIGVAFDLHDHVNQSGQKLWGAGHCFSEPSVKAKLQFVNLLVM